MRASSWRAPEASLHALACDRRRRCHDPLAAPGVVLAYALKASQQDNGRLPSGALA
jgi:hypothetical protein